MDVKKEKLTDDVIKFMRLNDSVVGMHEQDTFGQNTFCEIYDLNIDSPIEQLFYLAIKAAAQLNFIEHCDPLPWTNPDLVAGLCIAPQRTIGHYRVDFCVTFYRVISQKGTPVQLEKRVVVECDSQVWHERTEQERRYEKARDRYFSKQGIHVFHFTGKEIMEDPYVPACEVLNFVTESTDCFEPCDYLRAEVLARYANEIQ